MFRSGPGVLGEGTADSFGGFFAFNLLQLCIAGCVQWILIDLVSAFAFPCFLLQFLYFRLSCDAPKQMATPDEAFQTSAVQVNFSTRFGWGFLSGNAAQEKITSIWWQRERGPSRDGHGDAWARAWIWSPFREATKNLLPDVSQWTWSARRGDCRQFWRTFTFNLLQSCIAGCVQWFSMISVITFACHVFSFSFSISTWAVMSSNAPKQLDTPEDTFQTSVLQFNFSTRLGWGFPPRTAAQEQICFHGDNWNEDSVVTYLVMLEQEHGVEESSEGYCRQFWRIFALNLLQLCIADCVQWFSIDFGDHLRIDVFSLSVSLFPIELWYLPMLLSSWLRLKRSFRPQQFNSTFPLVLDEDSRRGLLHRRQPLPWCQLERGSVVKDLVMLGQERGLEVDLES